MRNKKKCHPQKNCRETESPKKPSNLPEWIPLLEHKKGIFGTPVLADHLYKSVENETTLRLFTDNIPVHNLTGFEELSEPIDELYSPLPFRLGIPVKFEFSGPALIYGYFVASATRGSILLAERFGSMPFETPKSGGTIEITPRFTLS